MFLSATITEDEKERHHEQPSRPSRPRPSVHRLVLAALRTRTRTQSDRTVLVLSPTGRYSYSVRIVELYHCVLVNALFGDGFSRWKVNQRPRRQNALQRAVSLWRTIVMPRSTASHRVRAIEYEPSSTSTSTVRLRVLSTSTMGSCSAMARTIVLLGQGRWFAS